MLVTGSLLPLQAVEYELVAFRWRGMHASKRPVVYVTHLFTTRLVCILAYLGGERAWKEQVQPNWRELRRRRRAICVLKTFYYEPFGGAFTLIVSAKI